MPLTLISLLSPTVVVKKISLIALTITVHNDPALAYPTDIGSSACFIAVSARCLDLEPTTFVALSEITRSMCRVSGEADNVCADSDKRFGILQYQMQLRRHCPSLSSDFADGQEGSGTREALKQFQAAYGLTSDGVYGPKTAKALAGPVNGKCP